MEVDVAPVRQADVAVALSDEQPTIVPLRA